MERDRTVIVFSGDFPSRPWEEIFGEVGFVEMRSTSNRDARQTSMMSRATPHAYTPEGLLVATVPAYAYATIRMTMSTQAITVAITKNVSCKK